VIDHVKLFAADPARSRALYHGAFVLDPDGNNVEAVYHGAMQPETTG
jgi:hypothetical protein